MKKTPETGVVSGFDFISPISLVIKFVTCKGHGHLLAVLTASLFFISSILFAGNSAHDRATGHGQFHGPVSSDVASTNLFEKSGLSLVTPNITVRLSNPQYNCETDEYCVDVEFQSDIEDQEVFGMNVRFFYEESILELIDFRDFQGGYDVVVVPVVTTSGPAFGYNFFRFGVPGNGAADFVNGAIQLVDDSQPPLVISTTGWTKLFQICFEIDDPAPDSLNFCPSIVLDLEQDPANGGYFGPADDGLVITVTTDVPGVSEPANEQVEQFNWMYTGDGSSQPFGMPVELNCIDISCGSSIAITCPADLTIACGGSTIPDSTGFATGSGGCMSSPIITHSDSITTGGCGEMPRIFRTWIAADTCNSTPDTCVQVLALSDAGSIIGKVLNDLGDPIAGVEIMLMVDINANESVDAGDTLFATTMTDSVSGEYSFNQVPPCTYVIVEALPQYHVGMSDYDESPDPDGDDQGDGADLEIPVVLAPCEVDSNNTVTNIVCPSVFPSLPFDTICDGSSVILEIDDLNIGLLTYDWSFGSGSNPGVGSGLGPHTIEYDATTENQSTGASVALTISKSGCPDTTAQITLVHVNPYPDPSIDGSTLPGCYYTNRVFVPVQPELPGATYSWDFGYGAVPPTASGYGPHTVYYDTAGTKTVMLTILPNEAGSQCPDSSSISFQINNCPANIVGSVKDIFNQPISGVNVHLYKDVDTDGVPDDTTVLRSVYTTGTGSYSMAIVIPGNYVIVEVQPSGWYSYDDGDPTADNDIVANLDSLDNLIPVTLVASELDAINAFVEGPVSGNIYGNVFDDLDGDDYPDAIEGIADVDISLFADNNADGTADSNIPVFSTVTLANGAYQFLGVPVGNYVLVESTPDGYENVQDFDSSNDADVVPNSDMEDDTIPVTLTNGEADEHNYFIDVPICGTIVTNTNDSGPGSLREVIECVPDNGTVLFHPSLAGATITINSARLVINKNIEFFSDCTPRITLASQISGFFDIISGSEVEFNGLDIISGLSGNTGAAFKNDGILSLMNITVRRNPLLPAGQYLIYNTSSSQLFLNGSCLIEMD